MPAMVPQAFFMSFTWQKHYNSKWRLLEKFFICCSQTSAGGDLLSRNKCSRLVKRQRIFPWNAKKGPFILIRFPSNVFWFFAKRILKNGPFLEIRFVLGVFLFAVI